MAAFNKGIELHQQWIGYLNPTGLVFSPHALEDAQVVIREGAITEQREFNRLIGSVVNDEYIYKGFDSIESIFIDLLNWRKSDLDESPEIIAQYSFIHPQFEERVVPTYVSKLKDGTAVLIKAFDQDIDFDKTLNSDDSWNSSTHFKFERLLREKQISTGFLVTKHQMRLVFAPRGETSGFINFPFKIMYQPSGRLVFSAFRELFSDTKLFNSAKGQSLVEILENSRKYQAKVSIELSEQVLAALYELLRGFEAANDEEKGKLLKYVLENNPQQIYEGLLTVLLRMVFIMYAEDRNLLATDVVYQSSYSLTGLYERLRQDEASNPDTMDSRYGAWAQLLSLFRLIYNGAEYEADRGKVIFPQRHGHLFDPSIYLFLEGRKSALNEYENAPKISDGVIYKVLTNLLVLGGERISYRTLDVEQIGSVYETMMGFELSIAEGETIALRPAKLHGAPLPINLEQILKAKDKSKKLGEVSDLKLPEKIKHAFNSAKSIDELERVLDKWVDRRATPYRLSKGAMVLSPSEARRKSGSHYTPRELTEPIVRIALRPIFERLGQNPKPEDILDLKICDPAMGSGAFLVEVCRQLAERLVESWNFFKIKIQLPIDEDELLYAKRIIAQKCLYGVDKNKMAVNLAKLSLWLMTLAKDHAFTFLDHSLRYGDSLVGITNMQIASLSFQEEENVSLFAYMKEQIGDIVEARNEIQNATDEKNYDALKFVEESYTDQVTQLRLVGDLIIKCFFDGKNKKERLTNIHEHQLIISNFFAAKAKDKLTDYCLKKIMDNKGLIPFHWELEFPEVFDRKNPGFDCFIGNPPFQAKNNTINSNPAFYLDWLGEIHPNSHGNSDIVAHFFRRCHNLLRLNGVFGLIATNTICQGDTRSTGLEQIVKTSTIFDSITRLKWPGLAAVTVSTVHVIKAKPWDGSKRLNWKQVRIISPFLLENEYFENPKVLAFNNDKSFIGSFLLGLGFIFDDTNERSTPMTEMNKIIKARPSSREVIFPYLGGEDINSSPTHSNTRFVINFNQRELKECEQWPELLSIVKEKVYPERKIQKRESRSRYWWRFAEPAPNLYRAIKNKKRVLVTSLVQQNWCITFVSGTSVFSHSLGVFNFDDYCTFAILQSTIHETWARFTASSLEDRLRYNPSDCFQTFPLPISYDANFELKKIGELYYAYRSELMAQKNEGMTKIYNRFHDPNETDEKILKLRELHCEMDFAVLKAYGWQDLILKYDFILDYLESEDDEESGTQKKKKPFRFKFVPDVYDEVLARLLKLNNERSEEEVRLGLHKK